jgi:hypothetical protein
MKRLERKVRTHPFTVTMSPTLGWRRMSEIDDVGMMYDAKRNFSTCKNGQNPAVQGSFFSLEAVAFGSF